MPLEPLPETRDALRRLAPWSTRDLLTELVRQAQRLEEIVPNLVGMSLSLVREGLTFTLAATSEHALLLDAIQYAFGGPCVDATDQGAVIRGGDTDAGLLDERRWARFARHGAARGVLSTLSLPVRLDGEVIGGVNLYAATPRAFVGREQRLAAIVGAWAPGAVHNADLTFSSRTEARRAPRALDELAIVEQAVGVVVAAQGVDVPVARLILAEAAHRTGRQVLDVAREIVRPFTPRAGDS